MGRQIGLFKFSGSIGDTIYYKTKHGFLTRKKSGIPKEKILNDPNFELTRCQMSEFSLIIKSAKELLNLIKAQCQDYKQECSFNSIISILSKIQKMDKLNSKGKRTISDGAKNLASLENLLIEKKIRSKLVYKIFKKYLKELVIKDTHS